MKAFSLSNPLSSSNKSSKNSPPSNTKGKKKGFYIYFKFILYIL